MATQLLLFFNKTCNLNYQLIKTFHSTSKSNINYKWRLEKKLARNPNTFGPLANFPDYSFKDGRPVPFGTNQKRRIDKQRLYLEKIKEYVGEIDYAVERHKRLQEEEIQQKQQIIDSKLKEKGQKLLKDKTDI